MLNCVFGLSPYTNPSHQLVPTHEVPRIALLACSSFFHGIERQGLDPKRLVNTGFVSQQKNLQRLKPKMRQLTWTFYLSHKISNKLGLNLNIAKTANL